MLMSGSGREKRAVADLTEVDLGVLAKEHGEIDWVIWGLGLRLSTGTATGISGYFAR